MKTVNLKSDMPSVQEALQRLEREMAVARQGKLALLKIIHGYGSSGVGGDIRVAVQKRLHELAEGGQIRACIFGENWSKTDEATWRLLQSESAVKSDPDLGRRNLGITIIPAKGEKQVVPGLKTEATSLHWKNFLQCVRTREKPVSDVEFALKVQAALDMSMLSFIHRKVTTFDPATRTIVV